MGADTANSQPMRVLAPSIAGVARKAASGAFRGQLGEDHGSLQGAYLILGLRLKSNFLITGHGNFLSTSPTEDVAVRHRRRDAN
jgi:hypothetical protein